MRITFLLPYAGVSGGIRVVGIYAERLQRLGHDVEILSLPTWLKGRRNMLKDLTRRISQKLRRDQWPSLLDGYDVAHRVLDRWRPFADDDVRDGDVVIATWWETAPWAHALSPSKGAKVYFLQGYDSLTGQEAARVDPTWRLPLHKVAVSQCLIDIAREKFGDHDVSLVQNSVDHHQFFAPPRDKREIPRVGFVYSHKPYRGSGDTIDAVTLARKQIPNLELVAFGMGLVVPEYPMPDWAEYIHLPPQNELRTIYASCDAWLAGTHFEGFGLPLLEAMACRTPVIATPAGAAPQLLANGGGDLVPVRDPQAMADAIVRLLRMPNETWKKVSDAAHSTAVETNWDKAAEEFEEALYHAVAKQRSHVLSVA